MVGRIARDTIGPGMGTTVDELSDEELLSQFLDAGPVASQEAFRFLVGRHGPRVLRICRHILNQEHDAEDAFQATFLALARKGASIRDRCAVAGWLHEVASRTALKTRAHRSRRRTVEQEVMAARPPQDIGDEQGDRASLAELRPMLHEEVTGLPDKYRIPVILSYLEGKTNEEVAAILKWPVGTVKGRLSRGRALLRSRLTRRGIALSTSALLLALSRSRATAAEVPEALLDATMRRARASRIPAASPESSIASPGVGADPAASPGSASSSLPPVGRRGFRRRAPAQMISGALVLLVFLAALVFGGFISSAAYGGKFPGWRSAFSGLMPSNGGASGSCH